MKKLSNDYISAFCMEISLLLKAGITINDGLEIMMDDDENADSKQLLGKISQSMDTGVRFSDALESTGVFPDYLIKMIMVSEKTGRQEETLMSLSRYYDTRERIRKSVTSSVLYPMILFVLMLVVIIMLMTKVLPVFESIFQQLGTSMTGFSGGLLAVGRSISAALPVLGILVGLIILLAVLYFLSDAFKAKCAAAMYKIGGERGIMKKISTAKFASAMTMTVKSGLNTESAVEMAASVCNDTPDMKRRCEQCLEMLADGIGLAKAFGDTKIFPPVYCRMLDLGIRSGTSDAVMEEISERLANDVDEGLNATVARIEPTLVIISALFIGIIMLAAMLPLINIMAAIG